MPDSHDPEDDPLLRRLHESSAGDAAARQLRRRYDQLREDYEALLLRLSELESRLAAPVPVAPPPVHSPAPAGTPAANPLADSLLGPLLTLREQYVEALGNIQGLVSGIDGLAAGAFKAQRGPGAATEPEPAHDEPRSYQVEARARNVGSLLDFQEQLRGLAGVARVAIHAIDSERATFIVELA
jgi:hypothetical protein